MTEAEAQTLLHTALQHHLAGRLPEAEAIYQDLLKLWPTNPDVLHLSGEIACQQGQYESASERVTRAIAVNPAIPSYHATLGRIRKGQGRLDDAVESYLDSLNLKPDQPELYNTLGGVLLTQGKLNDAETCFRLAISRKADYVEAYCNLGAALNGQGKPEEARACYQAVLAINPEHVDARYNLGFMYMMTQQPEQAEAWYRKALELDPEMVSAHVNLSWLLRVAGRLDEAQLHRDLAYRKQSLFAAGSPTAVRTVLVLCDAGRGNVQFRHLLPARDNNLIEWMVEYATEEQFQYLPPFDVVFNAIGDPDATPAVAAPLARFMAICDRPVLNSPAAVARTARQLMPELFGGVEGLLLPAAWRVEQRGAWSDNPDFRFPVLVRPPASQGGEGLALIESRAALAGLAPDRAGVVYLCNYHDYRSSDGFFRKYRIIFIDRRPYPYHLAISEQWMVHYHTADMLMPWKLEEERRFLECPARVLGATGMAAIEAIGKRLDLDYAGVDFSILPDGRLLIFEANATMLAHPEQDEALMFKNPYIQKIFDAFGDLLARSSGEGRTTPH
jgi:tetratricopeptide (TPR) repeat protein